MKIVSLFSGIGGLDWACELAFGARTVLQCDIEPACRRVLATHWPDNLFLCSDVKDLLNVPLCDIICGGFPCFPAGTQVLTKERLVPIETLKVGDEVLTHKGRWRRVTSVMNKTADSTVVLKGGFHYGLVTTAEHPFYASAGRTKTWVNNTRGWHVDYLEAAWVDAQHMQGKYWATPVLQPSGAQLPEIPDVRQSDGAGKVSEGPTISPELLWLLGCWVGDGWLRRRKDRRGNPSALIFSVARHQADDFERLASRAGIHYTRSTCRTTDKYIFSHRALAEWVPTQFGEKAKGKRLPTWLLEADREHKQAFFDGYCWADGYTTPLGVVKTASVSRELSLGAALLGTSLGLVVSLRKIERAATCVIEGRTVKQSVSYGVEYRKVAPQTSAFQIDQHRFTKCRSALPSVGAQVYNISVEEDESYTADGLVVHNCTDLSIAGKRKGIAEGEHSGLWREMLRLIQGARPKHVVVENSSRLLREPEQRRLVQEPLEALGYGVCWTLAAAEDVGAPHLRERAYMLATMGGKSAPVVIGVRSRTKDKWPTPVHQDKESCGGIACIAAGNRGETLSTALRKWPTPVYNDLNSRGAGHQQGGQPLTAEMRKWATPTHRDHRSGAGRKDNGHTPQLCEQVGGVINPEWEELLMGYPIGWTRPKQQVRILYDPSWPSRPGEAQHEWEPPRLLPPRTQLEGLTRRQRVGMLGNAVVPQQALAAISRLLQMSSEVSE